MVRALLIDPDPGRRQRLGGALRRQGCAVECAAAADRGCCEAAADVILANAAALGGDDFLARTRVPVIVLAERPDVADAVQLMRRGAANYLPCATDADALLDAIRAAAPLARTERTRFASPIIGEHPLTRELRQRIRECGAADAPLLIAGEPGSGKELAARAMHGASPRSREAFIAVNCEAISPADFEAELFGAPGRRHRSSGLVQVARRGTLFFDEIGYVPLHVQDRLAELMGDAAAGAQIRVLAATRHDLRYLSTRRGFRAHLLDLLQPALHVPPLRDRGDDALAIAQVFLKRASHVVEHPLRFSPDAIATLRRRIWPGNVRELRNAVEQAVALCGGADIAARMLNWEPDQVPPVIPPLSAEDGQTPCGSLESYFVRFVQANEERMTETELANALGISRKSLWERRQRLNIPRRRTRKRGLRAAAGV